MQTSSTKASYLGTFEHSFDDKGRLTIPVEWRQENYEKILHVFPSKEGCLKVYPESWLSQRQEEMEGLKLGDPQRKQVELLASIAQGLKWDEAGRVIVKEKLRSGAQIKKETVLVGCADHFEIWEAKRRRGQPETQANLEDVAAALGL